LLAVLGTALVLAAGCTTPATTTTAAEPSAPPKAGLSVGNSFFYYNNSMHGHVRQLLSAADPGARGYRETSATISGGGINWQDMEALFKPGGVASYSFDRNNNVVFNTFDKPFDVVIMMDCSQCPIHPQLSAIFYEHTAKNSAIVRRHGAEPVFFMSWAYADRPEMTEQLAAAYLKAGATNRAKVVPAGVAFAPSRAASPEIELYVADNRHPTLAGTYLAACTVLATVYGQSPVGNSYTAGLPTDVAAHLQATARQTVQSFKQPI
jgi:L-rhamnose mutarotase